jgi:threonine dehydratase
MNWKDAIETARSRIAGSVRRTDVERSPWLEEGNGEVLLKLENFQVTGSFKARGALNKLLALPATERTRGVVAASSGNHGAAVAWAAGSLEIPARVFVPTYADPGKIAAIEERGATVEMHGDDCVDTEIHARALARSESLTYISPYNDPDVVAGQGTIAVELHEQCGPLDAVFVAVGGGGMIGGIGAWMKAVHPATEIIACSPAHSPAMHAAMAAGELVEAPCLETLSDATAGGIEEGALTLALCQAVVDRSVLVNEAAIAAAMKGVLAHHHMLIEGAAGVAVAGYLQIADAYRNKRVAIILCGANIGLEKLQTTLLGT